ncbi:MAG TPA: efflux RND transporter periplasmic adaptor subunit [Syntrophales bacterium]|nr:efflux RND transporter periplasmic adaptor subunit [Syntrophales bacterium]
MNSIDRYIGEGALRFGALLLALLFMASCSSGKAEKNRTAGVPISVAAVVSKDVPFQIVSIGNVEAYNTISVKAQINGEIVGVHFKEGQYVNKGDLLYKIDPRPFEAALKQAEANLAKDTALARKSTEDVKRYQYLMKEELVPVKDYDQIIANDEALAATLKADRALVETNRLQLEYTSIRSPINGIAGGMLINNGNVVKANDASLVTINQVNPIYVTFAVPERNLPEIKARLAAGKLQVQAIIPGQEKDPETGSLAFIDNTVDKATGTIKLKGLFENRNRRLWPGQFISVTLFLYLQTDAIAVPSQAVQMGQMGTYVYVLKNDQTAEVRPVVVARTYGNDSIIEGGLKPGEQIVTDGMLMLKPGAKVQIKDTPGSQPGAAAPAAKPQDVKE